MKKDGVDIRELAKILNLSITTVSRVINGKSESYRISSETAERVERAAKEHHYSPSKIARGLKTEKTDTLGLIIPDISNPFFADIAHTIEKEVRSNGFSLILCDSDGNLPLEEELIRLLQSHKVEGIIIAPVGTSFDHIVQVFTAGMPLVVVDRFCPEMNLPFVTSDNYHGAYEAVNYLFIMGHKRIACIQGILESQPNKERIAGFRDACKTNGITIDEDLIVGNDFGIENGYRQARILFSMENPPTAIFALSNLISLGTIKAIREIGLKIPEDVSLISFDEQPYSAFLETPMTTVNQKKTEIAQLAVDILLKQIESKDYKENIVKMKLKTDLIIRESVRKI